MSLSLRARLVQRIIPSVMPDASMSPTEQRDKLGRAPALPNRRVVVEDATKRRIKRAFGRYLAPSVVERLSEVLARDLGARGLEVSADELVLTASTSEAYSFLFKLLADAGYPQGFEVTLEKNRGAWVRGFVNYTYLSTKNGGFGWGRINEDLRQFRQWGSKTPGHPERGHTTGVEVTTGPLGQGFANAVGMALAERHLRERFGAEVVDHRVFGICSDGDLQEGVTHEAAALAGHLRLGRLVFVYDDNHITIDGDTALAYSDDAVKRFEAYGWRVEQLGEAANDVDALDAALSAAKQDDERPTLLVLRSHIGYPSPKFTDSEKAHGSPLGDDEIRVTKEILGLPPDESFYVPDDVLTFYREAGRAGATERQAWEKRLADFDGDREVLEACLERRPLPGWEEALPTWEAGDKVATRKASGKCLSSLADKVPSLIAGSGDLTGNTGTQLDSTVQSVVDPGGRQVHYGIR